MAEEPRRAFGEIAAISLRKQGGGVRDRGHRGRKREWDRGSRRIRRKREWDNRSSRPTRRKCERDCRTSRPIRRKHEWDRVAKGDLRTGGLSPTRAECFLRTVLPSLAWWMKTRHGTCSLLPRKLVMFLFLRFKMRPKTENYSNDEAKNGDTRCQHTTFP
ncbi:unnamed protein product [Ectocarpus sp. 4 AP-2014]